MPNYCENVLTVEGSEAEVKRFIAENSDPLSTQDSQRILSFEMANQTPPEPPGSTDAWYHWRLANWGVKWDAADAYPWELTEYGEKVSARTEFSTAWNAPNGWMGTLATLYPQLMIQLDYVEHGEQFCGSLIAFEGDLSEDEKTYDPEDYGIEPWDEDEED